MLPARRRLGGKCTGAVRWRSSRVGRAPPAAARAVPPSARPRRSAPGARLRAREGRARGGVSRRLPTPGRTAAGGATRGAGRRPVQPCRRAPAADDARRRAAPRSVGRRPAAASPRPPGAMGAARGGPYAHLCRGAAGGAPGTARWGPPRRRAARAPCRHRRCGRGGCACGGSLRTSSEIRRSYSGPGWGPRGKSRARPERDPRGRLPGAPKGGPWRGIPLPDAARRRLQPPQVPVARAPAPRPRQPLHLAPPPPRAPATRAWAPHGERAAGVAPRKRGKPRGRSNSGRLGLRAGTSLCHWPLWRPLNGAAASRPGAHARREPSTA
jgi:hypothetical protein